LLGAGETLRDGRSVVVDATFLRAEYRAEALRAAAAAGAAALVLDCRAEATVIEARLRRRTSAEAHGSDADVAVYRNQRRFAPRDAAVPGLDRLIVHTDAGPDEVAERTLEAVWAWRDAMTAPASPGLRPARRPASQA
jgi:predicted kinase